MAERSLAGLASNFGQDLYDLVNGTVTLIANPTQIPEAALQFIGWGPRSSVFLEDLADRWGLPLHGQSFDPGRIATGAYEHPGLLALDLAALAAPAVKGTRVLRNMRALTPEQEALARTWAEAATRRLPDVSTPYSAGLDTTLDAFARERAAGLTNVLRSDPYLPEYDIFGDRLNANPVPLPKPPIGMWRSQLEELPPLVKGTRSTKYMGGGRAGRAPNRHVVIDPSTGIADPAIGMVPAQAVRDLANDLIVAKGGFMEVVDSLVARYGGTTKQWQSFLSHAASSPLKETEYRTYDILRGLL